MDNEQLKIILPIIRQVLPISVAQEILGVQPMTGTALETGETYTDEAASYATEANTVEWYWVRLPLTAGAIFNINQQQKHLEEVTQWCWDTFGSPNRFDNIGTWTTLGSRFCFKNAEDRTAFVLKWG